MSIKTKKPMIKETVGALYYDFNTPLTNGEYNPETYEEEVRQILDKFGFRYIYKTF